MSWCQFQLSSSMSRKWRSGPCHDVDQAVDLAEGGLGVGEQPLDVGLVGGVARPGDAVDLLGHVLGQVLLAVDADARAPARPGRG